MGSIGEFSLTENLAQARFQSHIEDPYPDLHSTSCCQRKIFYFDGATISRCFHTFPNSCQIEICQSPFIPRSVAGVLSDKPTLTLKAVNRVFERRSWRSRSQWFHPTTRDRFINDHTNIFTSELGANIIGMRSVVMPWFDHHRAWM